jgi:hypothetical protein
MEKGSVKPGMVAHASDHNTQEAEAGVPQVQSQLGIHRKTLNPPPKKSPKQQQKSHLNHSICSEEKQLLLSWGSFI